MSNLDVVCAEHPKYKARRRPVGLSASCEACWFKWLIKYYSKKMAPIKRAIDRRETLGVRV